MRVFVTGGTGFVGSAVVNELIGAGHEVVGLARSDASAAALRAAGADVLPGTLDEIDGLRRGAAETDGVIHLAFNYDYQQNEKSVAQERAAVTAMAEAISGSSRRLVVTSATAMAANADGSPSTEASPVASFNPRAGVETLVAGFVTRGAAISIVRLSQIHDTRKQGFASYLLAIAREKGVAAYIGDGANRWAAAHVSDTARLYRLAIERVEPGAVYHAVAEEGVAMKAIAEAHAEGLNVPIVSIGPEDTAPHFGWAAPFVTLDLPSSSAATRRELNWTPSGPDLLTSLRDMDYSEA